MDAITVPASCLRELTRGHTVARYQAGQQIFYAGHLPHGLWVLVRGAVLSKPRTGRRRHITAPAILGWEELLGTRPYAATVSAADYCDVAFFPRQEVLDQLEQFSALFEACNATQEV